jgi:DNA mismatch repair ATPase MutS
LEEITNQYLQRINEFTIERGKFRRFQKYFPLSRLITFILSGVLLYYLVKTGNFFYAISALSTFITFLVLGHLDIKYKAIILRLELLIQINQNEIDAVNGDFSKNDAGDEFTDFDHPYTYDLDMFGKSSLFQCINRTSTIYGKYRLADFLKNAYSYKNEINERQQIVRELSENIEFRQQLQLIFSDKKTNDSDLSDIRRWLQGKTISSVKLKTAKLILYLLNTITLTGLILSFAGIISYNIIWPLILAQLLFSGRLSRTVLKTKELVTSKFRVLEKYSQSLALIEHTTFQNPVLQELKNSLMKQGTKAPSKVINSLSGIINFMDSNLNLLVAIILNGFFSVNVHLLLSIEKWKTTYKDFIPGWFDIIGKIDAFSSLGNFSYNNPDFVFPKLVNENFVFSAKNIGHPLIAKDICVKNDLEINGWKLISIITGANMSGKSTLLRTIGTNYILAMTGCPVCAKEFIFTPVEIHTSMRTNDSLAKKESYFYAELKRLKEIIDELESGKSKFILLDEILKGTNSNDKRTGSMALINQLVKYNIIAMVATHDQVLGELRNEYPENITNRCFEISIVNDKMHIDFKLREGVCQNLNATYLMKNMGITFPEKMK